MRIRFTLLAMAAVLALACNKTGEDPSSQGGANTPAVKKAGITYQLNVYSFADSDGDGWGDFQGIIDHLDYLDSLGVNSLWLSPVQWSQSYHAYDIYDYNAINPIYGGEVATPAQAEAKFKELIDKAKERGIAIYMDYVLNHSGDKCEWFKKAISGDQEYRKYYVMSSDYVTDVRQGKVDNFAGQSNPQMGSWHSVVSGQKGYDGLLHFELDVTTASSPKITITQTTDSAQSDNTDASVSWYIYDNNAHRMYKKGDNTYEITLHVKNDWGVLVKDDPAQWGNHKWGAAAGDQVVAFGTPKTLVKGDAANDLVLGGEVIYYFASFDKSMPDLNYGPYTDCAQSPAFKALAESADKWIKMGIGGMRLDAVMWIYQCNAVANAAFLSAWYDHCNATYKANGGEGDFFMVGEAYDYNSIVVAPYFEGLPSCFDFPYYGTLKDRIGRGKGDDFAGTISGIVNLYKSSYASRKYSHSSGMVESPKLSNHDENRVASDLGNNDYKKRLAAAVLLTSPGNPFIYQGEELGYWGTKQNGDQNVRQPIYWSPDSPVPSGWSNFDKAVITTGMSVKEQEAKETSLLRLYRNFAKARNQYPALAKGDMVATSTGSAAIASWYMKTDEQRVLVLHNFSGESVKIDRAQDKLDKLVVSNQEVKVEGTSVTLSAYASAVFEQ